MGRYCRICGHERPDEQFSGRGHRIHVCKRCQSLPKRLRRAIEDRDGIFGFMAAIAYFQEKRGSAGTTGEV